MNFQYVHQREYKEGTIVIADISRADLEHMFATHSNQLMMLIGLSVKSKLDRFVKKEGREAAHKRLAPTVCEFLSVAQDGTTHRYSFETSIKHNRSTYNVFFMLTTVAESQKVRLVHGQFGL